MALARLTLITVFRWFLLLEHRSQDPKTEDSSWLRVQDRKIFFKRGLKHRATKERGFQEHARKRLPDLHEVDMMNPMFL